MLPRYWDLSNFRLAPQVDSAELSLRSVSFRVYQSGRPICQSVATQAGTKNALVELHGSSEDGLEMIYRNTFERVLRQPGLKPIESWILLKQREHHRFERALPGT